MKILYIAHRIPYPPDKGDKIRSFHTIEHLSRRHDLWCACFVDDRADFRHVDALRTYCHNVLAVPLNRKTALLRGAAGLLRGGTLTEGFYRHRAMRAAVRSLVDRVTFDAVLVFSSSMAQYATKLDVPRKVIDLCDLDSRKWSDLARVRSWPRSWLLRTEGRRLACLEDELYDAFDATVLISEAEGADWDLHDRSRLHGVANGVKLPNLPAGSGRHSQVVGFVGDMRYYPNEDAVRWFVSQVWPAVRSAVPKARFEIVGRSPSRAVRGLEACPGVRVVGPVEDVAEHLARFQVVVAPLRIARGIQNKVLEAMAAARPVVVTPAAARGILASDREGSASAYGVSGGEASRQDARFECVTSAVGSRSSTSDWSSPPEIDLEIGKGACVVAPISDFLAVADTAEAMAGETIRLLLDSGLCESMGASARRLVAERFEWSSQMATLDEILMGRDRDGSR